ncbi:hypothetical protein HDU93_004960 [Gonapodya sp. JEL0774]|nr:hypothetical protein HDU93_004960 [Gonapodya sp. JEL0774]
MLGSAIEVPSPTINDLPDELLRAIFLAGCPRTFYISVQLTSRRWRGVARTLLDPQGRLPILVAINFLSITRSRWNPFPRRVGLLKKFVPVRKFGRDSEKYAWVAAEFTFQMTRDMMYSTTIGVDDFAAGFAPVHTPLDGDFVSDQIKQNWILHPTQPKKLERPNVRAIVECVTDFHQDWETEDFLAFTSYLQITARPTRLAVSWKFVALWRALQVGTMDSVTSLTIQDHRTQHQLLPPTVVEHLHIIFPNIRSLELRAYVSSDFYAQLCDCLPPSYREGIVNFNLVNYPNKSDNPQASYKIGERALMHISKALCHLTSMGTLNIIPGLLDVLTESPVMEGITTLSLRFIGDLWDFRSNAMARDFKRISSALARSYPNLVVFHVKVERSLVHPTIVFRTGWSSLVETVPAKRFVFCFPKTYKYDAIGVTLRAVCMERGKDCMIEESLE